MDSKDFDYLISNISKNKTILPKKDRTKTVTATIPESVIKKIDRYAKATKQSKSKSITQLIEYGFDYLFYSQKETETQEEDKEGTDK